MESIFLIEKIIDGPIRSVEIFEGPTSIAVDGQNMEQLINGYSFFFLNRPYN